MHGAPQHALEDREREHARVRLGDAPEVRRDDRAHARLRRAPPSTRRGARRAARTGARPRSPRPRPRRSPRTERTRPINARRTISATVVPALSCASLVLAPRCGVTTTESSANSGESVVGSVAKTSSAAPPRWPLSIALARASSSTMPPRAVLIEPRPLLHEPQLVLADQPFGLRGARKVDRDEVGLHQQRLERGHRVDAHLLGAIGADVRVEGDHAHAEPRRSLRHECSDATEPDEADRLAGELHAFPRANAPTIRP